MKKTMDAIKRYNKEFMLDQYGHTVSEGADELTEKLYDLRGKEIDFDEFQKTILQGWQDHQGMVRSYNDWVKNLIELEIAKKEREEREKEVLNAFEEYQAIEYKGEKEYFKYLEDLKKLRESYDEAAKTYENQDALWREYLEMKKSLENKWSLVNVDRTPKSPGKTGPIYDDDANPTFYDESMNEI